MAQTITQSNPGVRANLATGRYLDTGTVAAYVFTLGFQPRYVKAVNLTDRNSMEWFEGMAAASQLHQVAAGTLTLVTTNGITVSASGFTLGLDTDVNVASKQVSWLAIS